MFLFWFNARVFTMPLTKDKYRTRSPNFWSEDHISYCTIVRGSDILHNVIVSGCVTFYQTEKLFVNKFFIVYKMYSGPYFGAA